MSPLGYFILLWLKLQCIKAVAVDVADADLVSLWKDRRLLMFLMAYAPVTLAGTIWYCCFFIQSLFDGRCVLVDRWKDHLSGYIGLRLGEEDASLLQRRLAIAMLAL